MEFTIFEQNSSGVNTPIPKMQIAYKEPMALASPHSKHTKTICELLKTTKSLFIGLITFCDGLKKFANLNFFTI